MAFPPLFLSCASTRGAAAIAVIAAPVARMSRLVESIIGVPPFLLASRRVGKAKRAHHCQVAIDTMVGTSPARCEASSLRAFCPPYAAILRLGRLADLVLRPRVEIAGVVAVVQ